MCAYYLRTLCTRGHTLLEQLNDIISAATAAISHQYFQLPILGGPPVWRERVYCYELYHQMRIRWPEDCPLILTGEVDKRAHPIFDWLEARQAIPDLLIHAPGNMAQNFAVIEVKSQQATMAGIRKDVATLNEFLAKVGYNRAMCMVFGPNLPAGFELVPEHIELWHHREVGTPATLINRG